MQTWAIIKKVKVGKSAAVDQKHLYAKASITNTAVEVENDRR
jgi:hypothetical protein